VKDRRAFIGTLAGGLLVVPLAAESQPARRLWRIGFLGDGSQTERGPISIGPFREGLRELQYIDGENVVIIERWSDTKAERLPELAAELVRLGSDVIVTHGIPGSRAAQTATKTIPIVVASSAPDFVGTGLAASLARPGANLTGLTDLATDLSQKEIQFLQEALPRLKRVAILWN
jgi:putative ABC transport system substrate-binding protein